MSLQLSVKVATTRNIDRWLASIGIGKYSEYGIAEKDDNRSRDRWKGIAAISSIFIFASIAGCIR